MAFLTTSVNHLDTRGETKIYEVAFPPQEPLNVTITPDKHVATDWVAMFQPEHRSYFPVGVAVHTNNEGGQIAHVLTICAGRQCLVFQLFRGHLSRDVLVFLRDVCTCYGWRTDAYDDLLARSNPFLSLGRLTDIQTLTQNGHNMGLGEFSVMALGRPVPEPTVSNWTQHRSLKKKQILETVLEAHISQVFASIVPHAPPPNNSLTRVISTDFPSFDLTSELADRTVYQVSINADQRLRVTYTRRAAVLTSWLSSLERGEMQSPRLIGIDVANDHRGRLTVMGLAFGNECLAYNLYKHEDSAGGLIPNQIFDVFLNSNCRFVGWSTTGQSFEDMNLGLRSERVLDVKTQFPRTHSYPDLARIVLGYEMPLGGLVDTNYGDWEIVAVAVRAYVCLMGGLHFGYDNPQ